MKVLFFGHDSPNLEQLLFALRLRWPDVSQLVASKLDIGMEMIGREEADLMIICENLPDMDASTVVRKIRHFSEIPIVVAIKGGRAMEMVRAIECGADDYIDMPTNPMIAMARVVAVLRRVGRTRQESEESPIHCGDLVIDAANHEVFVGSRRLELTPTEFKLLLLLVKNSELTLSQKVIQREIWTEGIDAGDVLKKYVQRLRRKLGDDAQNPTWIKTIHSVGYRFSSPVSATT